MTDILLEPDEPAAPAATQPVAHVDALPAGTRLAEFEIQGLLGVGGFGMVYRAYDHSLHRTVAIKEYMPAALAGRQDGSSVSIRSSADQATYQAGLQSFVGEARLLAQFDHPSLVKVYRFWEANNTTYMAMPLYSGMTLKQARSQMAAPPPEAWLRTVLWSILQALQLLHEHNTLHRDVSPDNIFLQDMGPPVLLDLGAARRAITDKSRKLTAILKVNFAPIEQYAEADDLHQGPWTDLYALAAVVYSCLRNDPPLPATARVVRDSMPSLQSVAQTVEEHFGHHYSDAFVGTVTHALAIQPADRPQSVQALIEEMALEAPPALGKFDWRADLGADLLPAMDDSSHSLWRTQPQTQPLAQNLARLQPPAEVAPADGPRGATGGAAARSLLARRKVRVSLGLVLTIVAAVALLAGLWLGKMLDETQLVAAPEGAATPTPAAPELSASEAALPVVAASAPALPLPSGGRWPVPSQDPQAVPVPPMVAVPAPVAGSAEPAAPRKMHGTPAPNTQADRPKSSAPKTAPKPASAPVAAKRGVAPSRELCDDANFLFKSMCIHRECEKPENAALPLCAEDRRRYGEPRP